MRPNLRPWLKGPATAWRVAGSPVCRLLLLAVLWAVLPGVAAAQGPDAVDCQQCHGDREMFAADDSATARMFVPDSLLRETRHQKLRCADCHPEHASGFPHEASAKAVQCQSCHKQEGAEWAPSIHAANARTAGDAPNCVSCHGNHTVLGAADRRSPTHPLNLAAMCGRCHSDPRIIGTYFMAPSGAQARVAVAQYYETVHGNALTRDGLVVSATCNDCHGAHKILPAKSPESSVNHANIPKTCGTCHVGILESYEQSAHGKAIGNGAAGAKPAPVCTDCHSGHQIVRADQPKWFMGVVEECGTCHRRLYETYFTTYHGQVTKLGFGLTAKCSDCHTAHEIRPRTDPQSSVYPANLQRTCQRCHPAANANFVKYYSHGDSHERTRYPALYWASMGMNLLLAGVFGFFGIHTLLWMNRLAINHVRSRRAAKAPSEEKAP
ncbi:MAG: hypothetical protein HY700_10515 [Gemmatimonadetes bacterium]|nr:hypothetical protein [Gemmatimonadota bacterium]